jgi:hypothetical protein
MRRKWTRLIVRKKYKREEAMHEKESKRMRAGGEKMGRVWNEYDGMRLKDLNTKR